VFLIYLGILLLSSATLLFEITLTRVFSVAQWYHFAFMVVSLALLGFGASGSVLSVFPGLGRRRLDVSLALFSIGFSASCLVGYVLVNVIPFDSFRVGLEARQLLYLVAYYVCLAVPFFFTGLALGVALSRAPANAGKVYGFNMIDSGLGCLLVLIGPSVFGGGGTVVLACLLGSAGSPPVWAALLEGPVRPGPGLRCRPDCPAVHPALGPGHKDVAVQGREPGLASTGSSDGMERVECLFPR